MSSLFVIGLIEILFGFLVAIVGILLATRVLKRLVGAPKADQALAEGNLASGVLKGAALLSLGILARHPVESGLSALHYLSLQRELSFGLGLEVAAWASLHAVVALIAGVIVLAAGTRLFDRLTGGVEEMEEIRKGNVAPAVVLGSVLVVLALLVAPGLETALTGLLPTPDLPTDIIVPED